jgi:hypothetical protein
MSEIFDIPDEKPKKKKREMTPEAKQKLLDRLKAGREKAKAKRAEAKKTMEPIKEVPTQVEAPVVNTEVEKDSEPETTDDNNLDEDDIRVLASEIEQLETKVNGYKKKEKKKKVGNIISQHTKKRNNHIDSIVAQKVAEQMAKLNKPVVKPVAVAPTPVRTPAPAPVAPIKKVSKFAGKIRPAWAKNLGFDI